MYFNTFPCILCHFMWFFVIFCHFCYVLHFFGIKACQEIQKVFFSGLVNTSIHLSIHVFYISHACFMCFPTFLILNSWFYYENRWKSMKIERNPSKIDENQWKSMKICENRWKSKEINAKSMRINENRCKSIEIHTKPMRINENR